MGKNVDNSAWGMKDFIERLVSDGSLSTQEAAKLLRQKADDLMDSGQWLENLKSAIREQLIASNGSFSDILQLETADDESLFGTMYKLRKEK